jgi:hypothetical protein
MTQKLAVANFSPASAGLSTYDSLGTYAGGTIVFDLGSSKTCTKYKIRSCGSLSPGGWNYGYTLNSLLSYWNGSSWVGMPNSSGVNSDFQTVEVNIGPYSAQYWRLYYSGSYTCTAGFQLYCQ